MNNKPINCRGCNNCKTKDYCDSWSRDIKSYSGIRYTADGFDCALPISFDTYNTCGYRCLYCFSNYLARDPFKKTSIKVGYMRPSMVEKFLRYKDVNGINRKVLDEVGGKNTNQCPIQWGALGDPFCFIERKHGIGLHYMDLFHKYNQPVRISTKGGTIVSDETYIKKFSKRPDLYWVAWSTISSDDKVLSKVDKDAPNCTERLKAVRALNKLGIKQSLRFRPIIPGISDSTKDHPYAWRDLIRRFRDAGAQAISMEFAFIPGAMPPHIKRMWKEIEKISGYPLRRFYKETSLFGSCLRSSRAWKEDFTYAIYEEVKSLGMSFGISDPQFKELNDFGCCCGIDPNDKIFGGWQRKQATNALLKAKETGCTVCSKDIVPEWSKKYMMNKMVCMTGPKNIYKKATKTWADKLRETWNDLESPRGTLNYFEGALIPDHRDEEGDLHFKFNKDILKRKNFGPVPLLNVKGKRKQNKKK